MSSKEQVLDQIRHASTGFEALLNNEVANARQILQSRPDSASHLVGLGIVAFLVSILSREEAELKTATETLQRAEAKANVEASARRSKGDSGVYTPGTEFKVLLGDATIGQALIAVMSESYVEFAKAVWKLNKSYKIFMSVHKIVFPDDIGEDESLREVFSKLNQHYLDQTTQQAVSPVASGSGLFGWGRKKNPALHRVRHSASSSDLPSASSSSAPADKGAVPSDVPASTPVTEVSSPSGSTTDLTAGVARVQIGRTTTGSFMEADEDDFPTPLWANDPLTTLIISGAALGSGLFGLIFSMMPPKMRKMISWFGFSSSSRSASLKLLKVAASTGNDVHGYFASLTLTTFYGFLLLMTGWQASEASYLRTMTTVLDRVHARFPNGTLWVLNRAKLARYSRRTDEAIEIIVKALAREEKEGNGFREADSLLVFELTWLYLSQAKFRQVADAAEKIMNSWSHATYVSIAAGALVDEINSMVARGETPDQELIARTEALFDRLPSLCTEKRTLGEKPVTETFLVRRLEAQRAKLRRWVSTGRLPPDAKLWQAIRISNSMELGLFWATVGGRSPVEGLRAQIDLLSSFTPKPAFVTLGSASSTLASPSSASLPAGAAVDLDTPAEMLLRDLLLGALYTGLGHYEPPFLAVAAKCLDGVMHAPASDVGEEKWVVPFATWHRAVVELKLGDVETADVVDDAAKLRALWKVRLDRADSLLDSLVNAGEYDLKTRLDSRILMLREEIRSKRSKLGIDSR
ncbi:hypothetical protein JCM3774_005817 [Rhodotorula dairenensis]